MPRGAFILFEGLDRAGKSTQCKLLQAALVEAGNDVFMMRFPNRTTEIGLKINDYLNNAVEIDDKVLHKMFSDNRWEFKYGMKCLFYRGDKYRDAITSKLEAGTTLIVDRYALSGVAYSSAKGLSLDWCKEPDVGLPAPDVVFFLDLPVEEASKRYEWGNERYEKESFQNKVSESFSKLWNSKWMVGHQFVVNWFTSTQIIDATQDIEVMHGKIVKEALKAIEDCKGKKIGKLWD